MRDDLDVSELSDDQAPDGAPSSLALGPGVYSDVAIADYVADPCVEASLRSSDLRRIIRLTPAHVRAFHPRLSERPAWAIKRATRRMDSGSIIHALVLGHGAKFTVLDPAAFLTKAGKPAKAETDEYRAAVKAAEEQGLIVLKPAQNEAVQRTADALRQQIEAELGAAITDHFVEHTLVWEEATDNGPVLCRTRPDLIVRNDAASSALCIEIKSTEIELDERGIQLVLSSSDGAYFVQAAWQLRGLRACYPELDGRVTHQFFFGEASYPHLVAPVSPSVLALEQADRRCRRAVEMFAQMRADGAFDPFGQRHDELCAGWPNRIGSMAPWLERDWMEAETNDATPFA